MDEKEDASLGDAGASGVIEYPLEEMGSSVGATGSHRKTEEAKWGKAKWPYIPFMFLLSFSYAKDDIEVFFLYCLFANTEYGCDFGTAFGIYLYFNGFLEIVIQPICAWTTDRLSTNSTVLLWIAIFAELIIECAMFMIPNQPFWSILVLQLSRSLAHGQNTLSLWKVFKQKLLVNIPQHQVLAQDDIINNTGMIGICGEVVIDVYVFFSGYYLSKSGYSFTFVSHFIYAMTILTTLIAFFISFFLITPSYVLDNPCATDNDSLASRKKKVSSTCPHGICDEIHIDEPEVELNVDRPTLHKRPPISVVDHFLGGLRRIFGDPITAGALFHALFVCLLWKVMSGAEPVTLAQQNEDDNVIPTVENLCAGTFTNLFYQYAWNNVFYVAGSIFYIVVLSRVRPYMFYQVVYPIAAVIFALTMVPLLFESTPYWIKVVCASTVGVFPWYFYRYDDYLATASCPTYYAGILQALVGLIRYISPSLAGAILWFQLESAILTITWVLLGLSCGLSLLYSWRYKARIQGLLSTHEKSQLSAS